MIKIDHLDFSHHHKVDNIPYIVCHILAVIIWFLRQLKVTMDEKLIENFLHLQIYYYICKKCVDALQTDEMFLKKGENETSLKCGISFVKHFIGDDVRKCIALKMQSDERSNLIHVE